jgi:class 3 adenylate cyclase
VASRELEIATRRYYSEEKVKSQLLNSILPMSVAEELQLTGSSKPVRIESATILFSDFVHFTSATKGIDPISIVALLTGYFTSFDYMAEKHRVERLKTIGDGYMCAAGIPETSTTHPIDICLFAMDMLHYVKDALQQQDGSSWNIRIGINTGSVTAGIIGRSKFSYDIWGEAVNMASRHESSGIEGGINVSKSTYLLTRNFFEYHPRGQVEIKGGDKLEMYELTGVKPKYVGENGLNKEYYDTYEKLAKGEMLLGLDV